MKKINKFGIWAFALVALADLFPQTAAAAGSIRSIRAVESFLDDVTIVVGVLL